MIKISDAVVFVRQTWRGDEILTGRLEVSWNAHLSQDTANVAGYKECARGHVRDAIWRELYGDTYQRLLALEHSLKRLASNDCLDAAEAWEMARSAREALDGAR